MQSERGQSLQIALSGVRGAGSIIKTLKIAYYCGSKASYTQGTALFTGVNTPTGFLPPQ
jgi:hypothetical protein